MRTNLLPALIGFALGATLIGGVSVAATKSASALKACRTTSGVLTLASKHGTCAHGQKKVVLNVTGPRGPRGVTGAQGPGAKVSIATNLAGGTTNGATITVAGTGLSILPSCSSGLAELSITGTPAYTVAGSYGAQLNAGANSAIEDAGAIPLPAGAGPVVYFVSADSSAQTTSIATEPGGGGNGVLGATVLVTVGSKAFTVSLEQRVNAISTLCQASALVTATS